jgi:hypothetical protein
VPRQGPQARRHVSPLRAPGRLRRGCPFLRRPRRLGECAGGRRVEAPRVEGAAVTAGDKQRVAGILLQCLLILFIRMDC